MMFPFSFHALFHAAFGFGMFRKPQSTAQTSEVSLPHSEAIYLPSFTTTLPLVYLYSHPHCQSKLFILIVTLIATICQSTCPNQQQREQQISLPSTVKDWDTYFSY
jgi:hypothetical protein